MATYGNETVDNYLYSSYNPYSYKYPKFKGWRQKAYFANYGEGETYFDNYHRAQLKSILSQINPNLTPRLRKANTKDVGIQVNPKTDASIQCSLGPRTLLARKRDALRQRRQGVQTPGSPISGGVRFPRTQAVYSPVESRRLVSLFREEEEEEEEEKDTEPKAPETVDSAEKVVSAEKDERKEGEESAKEPLSTEKNENKQTETDEQNRNEMVKSGQDEAKSKARVRFQVGEMVFGAEVWLKQFCRTCQKSFNPYRVEDITCQTCKKSRCTCSVTSRHVDPQRPHRQDLCGRCKGKRLSCDSTFSFKYII
ncbi:zygote arrest protein 1-like [Sinocyclocheilus anshuiensis]|uniref:zygote arrest protein 1-like n=1 Tax=Sinocyclocheilus anshuiensis TaxID=1608454 RepID=UPI0007B8285D|nr:PREDICTED: zygote arrest protein 1-like [Sinocyclocheilus anshuiensis]